MLGLGAAAVAALGWWMVRGRTPSSPARPDVLLITVDTLRADHLGCYGALHAATPRIDALAASGTLFENASCPMPLTRPSHFSIMTARYPREHGVMNNQMALPAGAVTLAQALAGAGYRTGAFVAVRLLGADSGAGQGFETFEAPAATETALSADRVVARAAAWLASPETGPRGDAPRFLWVHLFDPHMPYVPHEGATPPATDPIAQELPEVSWPRLVALAARNDGRLPAEVLARARALYDGEIAFTDRWVGALLDAVDARAGRPPAIVAFTADHGECFDHGIFFEHSDCLYDGAVRVPLLLRGGRMAAGTRVAAQVENLDLAPTLLALAGVAAPAAFGPRTPLPTGNAEGGTSRAAFIQHPAYAPQSAENRLRRQDQIRSVGDEPVRPLRTGAEDFAVRTGRWKYIESGPEEELYDLAADPAEARNVVTQQASVRAELRRALEGWLSAHPASTVPAVPLTEEQKQTLRALGYLQ